MTLNSVLNMEKNKLNLLPITLSNVLDFQWQQFKFSVKYCINNIKGTMLALFAELVNFVSLYCTKTIFLKNWTSF